MIVLVGGLLPGGAPVEVGIYDGTIVAVGRSVERSGATLVEVSGRTLVPAVVDAHVHLALFPKDEELARGGVAAAVDWGAPLASLARESPHLRRVDAGPLLTAPKGYPTQSWGRDGYGLEVEDGQVAVEKLVAGGAQVVKVAMAGDPALTDAQIEAIVLRAHGRKLLVGAHALSNAEASRAARLGIDILVHTPTEALSEQTVMAWKGRAVISTLGAFGSSGAAIDNLRRLKQAGATVLYGTDLGNSRDASIQCEELAALEKAGLTGRDILTASTVDSAQVFDLPIGLMVGKDASLLALERDPLKEPMTLCKPAGVWIRGKATLPLPKAPR